MQRKVVTILFCDIVGSTALGETADPEALRALLARYFERMKEAVERHGGTVEKFIGDAVMAVFGIPVAHEDDALRACRAALEMRESFGGLGIEGRIGLTTGEVVTGTEERLATGDAVNVAARLQQAAEPGEVLVDDATLELVRQAVDAEALEPLAVKGKAELVAANRLLAVHEAPERNHDADFVGRELEVALIREAWKRALSEQRCELATIVGEAGVGKSRLVAEALGSIGVRTAHGRCLPYGEGITYWPVVEVIKQLGAKPSDASAAAAIGSLLGESEAGTSAEEIAWAFRKLLEEQAPLIVVFDDIQWGEETFLDLIEHLALLSSGSPILLVCMARTDLVERRATWPVTLRLEPLQDDEVVDLIGAEVPAELRERITGAAGGNPLFVTEMLAIAGEAHSEVTVPPTLRALLAARLDQLDSEERSVLERAAVEGEIFHRGALQALADGSQVTPNLASLVRKGLIRPDRERVPGDDAFRFRHLLLRDAAYDVLPKATRADLHERFAAWLEQKGSDLVELDELLGVHLEQAARYKAELGQSDPGLADRAGERLAAAGRRAASRGDRGAAAPLLERSLAMTRALRCDVRLELDLAEAQRSPQSLQQSLSRQRSGLETPATRLERHLRSWPPPARARTSRILAAARSSGSHARRSRSSSRQTTTSAWRGSGKRWSPSRICKAASKSQRRQPSSPFATSGSQDRTRSGWPVFTARWSPDRGRPTRRYRHSIPSSRRIRGAWALLGRARLLAMLARFEEAWEVALPADERLREISGDALGDSVLAEIAVLAGDHATAAGHLRLACDMLERHENRAALSTYAPALGRSLCMLGRHDEAEPLAQLGRDLGYEEDPATQGLWRQVQALVHAHRGQHADAERLAREAVEIAERTDGLTYQGDALCDLAEVLSAAGRADEAARALEEALGRYERKRNLAMAEQVRAKLAQLQPAPAEPA